MSRFRNPRIINPESVIIGDEISVEYPPSAGVTLIKKGVVAKRVDVGLMRFMDTEEGATLFTWEPGVNNKFKITLLARQDNAHNVMLFDDEQFPEVKERIYGRN